MKTLKETDNMLRGLWWGLLRDYNFDTEREVADPVSKARYLHITKIQKFLEANGFPQTQEDKVKLSLVPLIFQEANYDSMDWSKKDAKLGQLQDYFDADFIVQNQGKEKSEVTNGEYKQYFEHSLKAIDYWKDMIAKSEQVYSMDDLNLRQTIAIVKKNNIPTSLYCVGGLGNGECIGISDENGQWQTYYSEKGGKSSVKVYANESSACLGFLKALQHHLKDYGLGSDLLNNLTKTGFIKNDN